MKTDRLLRLLTVSALAASVGACHSDAAALTRQDEAGHYASTSEYRVMDRSEFRSAIRAGLADFDAKLLTLENEAEALGPDAREEYYGDLDQLRDQRATFAAEFERLDAMLDADWREHKEEVAELYVALRASLDDTFDEVVEEGRS